MVLRLGLHMYKVEIVNLNKRQILQTNDKNSGVSNNTSICSQENGTSKLPLYGPHQPESRKKTHGSENINTIYYSNCAKDQFFYSVLLLCICKKYENRF